MKEDIYNKLTCPELNEYMMDPFDSNHEYTDIELNHLLYLTELQYTLQEMINLRLDDYGRAFVINKLKYELNFIEYTICVPDKKVQTMMNMCKSIDYPWLFEYSSFERINLPASSSSRIKMKDKSVNTLVKMSRPESSIQLRTYGYYRNIGKEKTMFRPSDINDGHGHINMSAIHKYFSYLLLSESIKFDEEYFTYI